MIIFIKKHTAIIPINAMMNASIFRIPSLCKYNSKKVSRTVILTPMIRGSPNNNCMPIAIPNTSARSVAAMAISAKIQSTKFIFLGYDSLFACARSRPLTIPSLALKLCNNIAIRLLASKTQIKVNPYLLPPARSVAQFPGSI